MTTNSAELKPCSVTGCGKQAKHGDRLCSMHRTRLSRTGRLDKRTLVERILGAIERIPESGCWIWMGQDHNTGYGRIKIGSKNVLAHRAAYTELVGPIPDGALVRHRCDVPMCVNPHHLAIGSHEENMADMRARGRQQRWCTGRFGSLHPSWKGGNHG